MLACGANAPSNDCISVDACSVATSVATNVSTNVSTSVATSVATNVATNGITVKVSRREMETKPLAPFGR